MGANTVYIACGHHCVDRILYLDMNASRDPLNIFRGHMTRGINCVNCFIVGHIGARKYTFDTYTSRSEGKIIFYKN